MSSVVNLAEYDWNITWLNKPGFETTLNLPEHGGGRMFLNMLGFLICLNKNKHDWISLEYASICPNYNVNDTVKLLQIWAASIRERRSQNCIKRPGWRFGENVYYGILNIPWSLNVLCDRNMSEFWICVSMLLNNARVCLNIPENKI